jgi:hypothetical protein
LLAASGSLGTYFDGRFSDMGLGSAMVRATVVKWEVAAACAVSL